MKQKNCYEMTKTVSWLDMHNNSVLGSLRCGDTIIDCPHSRIRALHHGMVYVSGEGNIQTEITVVTTYTIGKLDTMYLTGADLSTIAGLLEEKR